MILSMTGYGKATIAFQNKKITAEIKSLNSKSLDLSTKICQLYREKEMEIRSLIGSELQRGKVDFSLYFETDDPVKTQPINAQVFQGYVNQIKELSQQTGLELPSDWFSTVLRLPDVLTRTEVIEPSQEELEVAMEATRQAIAGLIAFRRQEGQGLYRMFAEKISNIKALLASIEPFEKERIEKIKARIKDSLNQELGMNYDANRFEQELIYYIEKLDINEEKQRLSNHLKYFMETMDNGEGQGKKLGFIAQEMGREINTTGSKSNHSEMQNIVVQMKDQLEQIKEQVLNVM